MKVPQNVLDLCGYLEEKKAEDIVIIDTTKMSNIANYNIIVTATSTAHTKGIADFLEEEIAKNSSINLFNREGFNLSEWIILDWDDIFVHIFTKEKRDYYNLEKLLNEGNNSKTYKKFLKEIKKQSEKVEKSTTKKIRTEKVKKEKIKKDKPIKKAKEKPVKKVKEKKEKNIKKEKPSK